ncbi:glutathione S-transferase P-like [Mizuhopecten yessoensis]|uniref:glutathione transferase n=1 Tax=Mizuhopecten yessoensis TaxID=6573 RepID=A0A210Q711_MIZYE|nr:glutathione S-transferase P-like [Mizuhopecten yessoensis]OWF44511.1 Glutathione S-transferase P [Mizuhopecten yessoensis]
MELIYFPVKGRAEVIRLMLIDNGTSYTETSCANDWDSKWKPKMAFGQTPCLKDGDLTLVQSNSIIRHLARKFSLYGANEAEACRADIINDSVEDLRSAYVNLIYNNYDAGKEEYINKLPAKLQYFEKYIEGKSPYVLGDHICFADYSLFELLDIHLVLAPSCLDKFPALKALHTTVGSRQKVKAHRDSDAVKAMPINGNGKQ